MGAVRARPNRRTSSLIQWLHINPWWRHEGSFSLIKVILYHGLHVVSVIWCLTLLRHTKQCSKSFSRLISFSQTVWAGAKFFWSHSLPSGVSSTPARCTSIGDMPTPKEDRKEPLILNRKGCRTTAHMLIRKCCIWLKRSCTRTLATLKRLM